MDAMDHLEGQIRRRDDDADSGFLGHRSYTPFDQGGLDGFSASIRSTDARLILNAFAGVGV